MKKIILFILIHSMPLLANDVFCFTLNSQDEIVSQHSEGESSITYAKVGNEIVFIKECISTSASYYEVLYYIIENQLIGVIVYRNLQVPEDSIAPAHLKEEKFRWFLNQQGELTPCMENQNLAPLGNLTKRFSRILSICQQYKPQ